MQVLHQTISHQMDIQASIDMRFTLDKNGDKYTLLIKGEGPLPFVRILGLSELQVKNLCSELVRMV